MLRRFCIIACYHFCLQEQHFVLYGFLWVTCMGRAKCCSILGRHWPLFCTFVLLIGIMELLRWRDEGSEPESSLLLLSDRALASDSLCRQYDSRCFNASRCPPGGPLQVYVYDDVRQVHFKDHDSDFSQKFSIGLSTEFQQLMDAVRRSRFYVSRPELACLFLPPVDLLNLCEISTSLSELQKRMLGSLSNWNGGENHLVFNLLLFGSQAPSVGKAILAGAQLPQASGRIGFDIVIPFFNPLLAPFPPYSSNVMMQRKVILLATLDEEDVALSSTLASGKAVSLRATLVALARRHADVTLLSRACFHAHDGAAAARARGPVDASRAALRRLRRLLNDRCILGTAEPVDYPDILLGSEFCLLQPGAWFGAQLADAVKFGCIPVIFAGQQAQLPFADTVDWARVAVTVHPAWLDEVVVLLTHIDRAAINRRRAALVTIYERYFSSISAIAMATLETLERRLVPAAAEVHSYEHWNDLGRERRHVWHPLLYPRRASSTTGFTLLLYAVAERCSLAAIRQVLLPADRWPSLQAALIVCAAAQPAFTREDLSVGFSRPLTLVLFNDVNLGLSGRFYPFDVIETEAVFATDVDFVPPTASEVYFAFQVWLENPSRLVGLESRIYRFGERFDGRGEPQESSASFVLTSLAFFHKFYLNEFIGAELLQLRRLVGGDDLCQHLLLNLLVLNQTAAAPIKVLQRPEQQVRACAAVDKTHHDYHCAQWPVDGAPTAQSSSELRRRRCLAALAAAFDLATALPPLSFVARPVHVASP